MRGSNQTLDNVTLWPRSNQAGDGVSFPSSFTIAGSADGSSWTTLVTKTGHSTGVPVQGPQVFDVPAGAYRYVRVTATQLGQPVIEGGGPTYRFQLAELEVARVRVGNAGFETGGLAPWINTAGATVTSTCMRSGRYAAMFGSKSAVAGDVVYLGAKDFGGTEIAVPVGTTWYTTVSVTFPTGPSGTIANLYAYKNSGSAQAWVDDLVPGRARQPS